MILLLIQISNVTDIPTTKSKRANCSDTHIKHYTYDIQAVCIFSNVLCKISGYYVRLRKFSRSRALSRARCPKQKRKRNRIEILIEQRNERPIEKKIL